MRFAFVTGGALLTFHIVNSLIEPTNRNGTVAEKSFVHPDLSKDVTPDALNLYDPHDYEIPFSFQERVNALESRLGMHSNSTQVDLRSGRVESLTLAYPILPGNGFNNGLLWSVSPEEDTTHTSPMLSEEWEELAIQAVKNWMLDHASDLGINVETELFTKGSVRTAVHGDGDMIQLHMPRIFKGVRVLGSRAMATIKKGNLINIGFEDWGSIPPDFSVDPTLTVEDAYAAVTSRVGHRMIRGQDNCNPEIQILTMTPSPREFGKGYEYVLVWRVCPLFEHQDIEAMEGLVDAKTGEIYSFIDMVHYFEAKGGVYPISNDKRDANGIEQPGWPMPYMYVGNEMTDTGGNYFKSGSVEAIFKGDYLVIEDDCGNYGLSDSGGIDWGTSTGTNCRTPGAGGKGNTHSSRTNFYELNKVMEIARSHLPNNKWLQKTLTSNVNINDSCNAWWLNTINFYRKGGSCGNTGELAGVIIHEW